VRSVARSDLNRIECIQHGVRYCSSHYVIDRQLC